MSCRGPNGVVGEGGASGAEISGVSNGRSGGGVGDGKVAGAGVSKLEKKQVSFVAVVK